MTTAFIRRDGWTAACRIEALEPGRGVAVLLGDGRQVALFLLSDGSLWGVGNVDPFGRAAVMSRGIVGDRFGEPTVASPLQKQVFSLIDGRCIDDDTRWLETYPIQNIDGVVYVQSESR